MLIAGHWWLMPIILASWETEIKRIAISGYTRENSLRDFISMEKKFGVVAHAYLPSYGRKHKIGEPQSRPD
jgi:hypothetical protein